MPAHNEQPRFLYVFAISSIITEVNQMKANQKQKILLSRRVWAP